MVLGYSSYPRNVRKRADPAAFVKAERGLTEARSSGVAAASVEAGNAPGNIGLMFLARPPDHRALPEADGGVSRRACLAGHGSL